MQMRHIQCMHLALTVQSCPVLGKTHTHHQHQHKKKVMWCTTRRNLHQHSSVVGLGERTHTQRECEWHLEWMNESKLTMLRRERCYREEDNRSTGFLSFLLLWYVAKVDSCSSSSSLLLPLASYYWSHFVSAPMYIQIVIIMLQRRALAHSLTHSSIDQWQHWCTMPHTPHTTHTHIILDQYVCTNS